MSSIQSSPHPGSSFRLVNLALAMSALMGLLGAIGVLPTIVPARWLLRPHVAEAALPHLEQFVARIGINLWLPASVLMLVFCLFGLHRRRPTPDLRWPAIVLAATWIASVLLTVVTVALQGGKGGGLMLMLVGAWLKPVYTLLALGAVVAACLELRNLWRDPAPAPSSVPLGVIAWALLPPVLSVLPLLNTARATATATATATASPAATASDRPGETSPEWQAVCATAGMRLEGRVAGPVTSLARDWDPAEGNDSPGRDRLDLDASGRVVDRLGGPRDPVSEKVMAFAFTEGPSDSPFWGMASIDPYKRYYRFPPPPAPYYGVDELSADLLAHYHVESVPGSPVGVTPWRRHTITLTDRRSGERLGELTYVFDQANRRACGANIGNTISVDSFIYDAIHR
jgi:hypothetical protein